ncbi:hypothetical protein GJ496_000676 [Pomphorhynchus laevis]|nr:hypothetical protein GJ496_000676 [Pomphorhynchus laevis]
MILNVVVNSSIWPICSVSSLKHIWLAFLIVIGRKLFIYLLLCLVNIIRKRMFLHSNADMLEMKEKLNQFTKKRDQLSITDDFAAYARTERVINRFKQQKDAILWNKTNYIERFTLKMTLYIHVLSYLVTALFVYFNRNTHIPTGFHDSNVKLPWIVWIIIIERTIYITKQTIFSVK